MSTNKCPSCGEEIQDNALRCEHCGSWNPEKLTNQPQNKSIIKSCAPLVLFVFIVVILLASVFAIVLNSSSPNTYRLRKTTGLYNEPVLDSEPVDILFIGTRVRPANGNDQLECQEIIGTESELTFKLCHVIVVKTGQTGYVLGEWLNGLQ